MKKYLMLVALLGSLLSKAQEITTISSGAGTRHFAPAGLDTFYTINNTGMFRRVTRLNVENVPLNINLGSVRDMTYWQAGVWLATDSGLVRWENGVTTTLSLRAGNFIANDIRRLLVFGNQLAVLSASGISVNNGTNWQHFSQVTPGFPLQLPTEMRASSNGFTFVVSDRVYHFRNGIFSSFAHGLNDTISLALQNSQGFYFLMSRTCLYQRNLAGNTDTINQIPSASYDIQLLDGSLGVVSQTGAYFGHFDGDRWTFRYGPYVTPTHGNVAKIMAMPDNRLIIQRQGQIVSIARPNFIGTANTERRNILDINNIKALFSSNGNMFWDEGASGNSAFSLANSGSHTSRPTELSHGAGWWIGGLSQGQLYQTAQTYNQSSTSLAQFSPGTLNAQGVRDTNESVSRVWKISRKEIADFNWAWAQGLVQNGTYRPSYEMRTWPGNRVGSTEMLAPFVDRNGDGIYNCLHGDYPNIKGDLALWWVMHDVTTERSWPGLGLEVSSMAYAFVCPTVSTADSSINYSIFLDAKITNRSARTYDSTIIGFFQDFEIASMRGTLVGTDVNGNGMYAYARSNLDTFSGGFGTQPPALGTYWLQGPTADLADGMDNNFNGVVDEVGEIIAMTNATYFLNQLDVRRGNPNSPAHFRNLSAGRWLNGEAWVYGGSGISSSPGSTSMNTRFVLPGNADSIGRSINGTLSSPVMLPFLWGTDGQNLANDIDLPGGQNAFYDIRMVSSCGAFQFAPGASKTVSLAFIYSRGASDNLSSVQKLILNDAPRVKQWYQQNQFPSCLDLSTVSVPENANMLLRSYPNPASHELYVDLGSETELRLSITDMQGRMIQEKLLQGQTHYRIDLPAVQPGLYFLHWSQGNAHKVEKLIVH